MVVDRPRSELLAARRALACVAHELGGSLQALFTYLRLAERSAPSPHLASAIAAASRLGGEVQAARTAGAALRRARVDVAGLVPRGVPLERHGDDAGVEGDAGALGEALGGLLRVVAGDGPAPPVTLSAGEHELRVLVGGDGGPGGPGKPFDPLVADAGERVDLAQLVAAMVVEQHGGRLLRAGAPGAWRFELVLPRRATP